MNDLALPEQEASLVPQPELSVTNHKPVPPADANQLRTEHVGALLGEAYKGASTLKLKLGEAKELTADFPDEAVEIRPHDGIIYISHMILRDRLISVFGPTEQAEICRDKKLRTDTNEVMVDLVLMARGKFLAEGIGTAKYYPNNPKTSYGDAIESAWSDALRRCCKKIGVGVQVWRPAYVREFLAKNAVNMNNRWYRKDDPRQTTAQVGGKSRTYELKSEKRTTAAPEGDEDDKIPF